MESAILKPSRPRVCGGGGATSRAVSGSRDSPMRDGHTSSLHSTPHLLRAQRSGHRHIKSRLPRHPLRSIWRRGVHVCARATASLSHHPT